MTKDSQEVRNGKPSRLTTGLLVGSMLFGLSSISGCTGPGVPAFLQDNFAREVREEEHQQMIMQLNRKQYGVLIFNLNQGGYTYMSPERTLYRTKIENGIILIPTRNGVWVPAPKDIEIISR